MPLFTFKSKHFQNDLTAAPRSLFLKCFLYCFHLSSSFLIRCHLPTNWFNSLHSSHWRIFETIKIISCDVRFLESSGSSVLNTQHLRLTSQNWYVSSYYIISFLSVESHLVISLIIIFNFINKNKYSVFCSFLLIWYLRLFNT